MFPLRFAARSVFVCAALVVPAVGCSSKTNSNKEVYAVRGQIFVDKKPAAGAFVLFIPVNEPKEATEPRPRAEADDEGKFSLSTYGDKDGAPAGEYAVTVTWPGKVLPDGREEPPDKLMGRYSDPAQKKLTATVKAEPNDLTFHLK